MRAQTLILFGRSGSGKGTQADLLSKYITQQDKNGKVLHIELGEKLREFAAKDNYTARLTKQVVDEGGLLPAFMPAWTWTNLLIENFSGKEHLILEGLARYLSQAQILDSELKFYNCKNPIVIVVNVSREWATEHLLKRGRSDDNPEIINRRMTWFDTHVMPVIEYFRHDKYYTVMDINGEQPIEKVHQDIISAIDWGDD